MIETSRLKLVPATIASLEAELAGREEFAKCLGFVVPNEWPPELYDRQATEYTLECHKANPEFPGWWLYYIVLDEIDVSTVVGTCGYKGPPDETGSVEVGYGVLPQFQYRGIATEATLALIEFAFSHQQVKRVIAETLPELHASIKVMEKCGLRFAGEGSEEGVIRYSLEKVN